MNSHWIRRLSLRQLFTRKAMQYVGIWCGLWFGWFFIALIPLMYLLPVLGHWNTACDCSRSELWGDSAAIAFWIALFLASVSLYFLQSRHARGWRWFKAFWLYIGIFVTMLLMLGVAGIFVDQGDVDRYFLRRYFNGDCRHYLSLTYGYRSVMFYPCVVVWCGVLASFLAEKISLRCFFIFLFFAIIFLGGNVLFIADASFPYYREIFLRGSVLQGSALFVSFMRYLFFVLLPLSLLGALYVSSKVTSSLKR